MSESSTLAVRAVGSRLRHCNVLVIMKHEVRCLNGSFTSKNKRGGIIVSSPGRISNYYTLDNKPNIKYTRNYKGEKYDQNGAKMYILSNQSMSL